MFDSVGNASLLRDFQFYHLPVVGGKNRFCTTEPTTHISIHSSFPFDFPDELPTSHLACSCSSGLRWGCSGDCCFCYRYSYNWWEFQGRTWCIYDFTKHGSTSLDFLSFQSWNRFFKRIFSCFCISSLLLLLLLLLPFIEYLFHARDMP